MRKPPLTEEDQARLNYYFSAPNHQLKRKPFRPWLLLTIIILVLTLLSGASYLIAWRQGVV